MYPETDVTSSTTPDLEKALQSAFQKTPVIGDMVNYVLPTGRNKGAIRPAIIVRTWGSSPQSAVQLQVFTDGTNDFDTGTPGSNGLLWATSVPYNEDMQPGTYHRRTLYPTIGDSEALR